MKITSSDIQFFTEYRARVHEDQQAKRLAQFNRTQDDRPINNNTQTLTHTLARSEEHVALNSSRSSHTYSNAIIKRQGEEAAQQQTTQKTVSNVLERFYSQRVRLSSLQLNNQQKTPTTTSTLPSESQTILGTSRYYEYQENQQLSFVAQGQIQTSDGRAITFEFYASASQAFRYQQGSGDYAAQVTRRTDPLVINLEGDFNHLSSASFEFDLDADGEKETLSFAGRGSGFLVLDKNNDGTINDGTELFGTQTGNGFNELAQYDEDGNGFIDAGDAVYQRLQVWSKDENGEDRLVSLKEADVAAIGTDSGFSPFSIKDDYNNEYGQARQTGIFVRESGSVGSVQQIDLSHRDKQQEQVLATQFDKGEQAQQTDSAPEINNAPATPLNNEQTQAIHNAMGRLTAVTEKLLQRQDELAQLQDDDTPKSLVAQIVEKLEEIRRAQQEKTQQEANDKDK